MKDIEEVLDLVARMNINRCSYTTFDLGIQECVRQEILRGLAEHYGVVYHYEAKNTTGFPVRGTRG